jgi:hypothetical protein
MGFRWRISPCRLFRREWLGRPPSNRTAQVYTPGHLILFLDGDSDVPTRWSFHVRPPIVSSVSLFTGLTVQMTSEGTRVLWARLSHLHMQEIAAARFYMHSHGRSDYAKAGGPSMQHIAVCRTHLYMVGSSASVGDVIVWTQRTSKSSVDTPDAILEFSAENVNVSYCRKSEAQFHQCWNQRRERKDRSAWAGTRREVRGS